MQPAPAAPRPALPIPLDSTMLDKWDPALRARADQSEFFLTREFRKRAAGTRASVHAPLYLRLAGRIQVQLTVPGTAWGYHAGRKWTYEIDCVDAAHAERVRAGFERAMAVPVD